MKTRLMLLMLAGCMLLFGCAAPMAAAPAPAIAEPAMAEPEVPEIPEVPASEMMPLEPVALEAVAAEEEVCVPCAPPDIQPLEGDYVAFPEIEASCAPCADLPLEGTYVKLSADEAKDFMDNFPEAVIVDVRTQAEYDEGHIPGAILIPNETISADEMHALLPDKEADILIYCRSGNRSKQASEKLIEAGYLFVYDFGGINAWPYEITKN